ncbi:MAG: arginine--tRNA ligase [Elusimicrobiota bacterium]
MILERLKADIEKRLRAWAAERGIEAPPPVVLKPAPEHVRDIDIALPWPLALAKALKRNPLEIAREAGALLAGELPAIESAEAAKPGFVNLRFTREALTRNLADTVAGPGRRGEAAPEEAAKRRILLEFVSANPTGPVHVASARAATLGDVLARILRRRGHTVLSEYYFNDAGKQVELLGLSVKARYDQLHGKDAQVPEGGYQGDYIVEIAKAAPAEASGWEAADFGRLAVARMLESHRSDMDLFGVRFDRWFRESELHERQALEAVLDKLKKLGRVHEKEGAVWLGAVKEGGDEEKERVLVRSDGRPTYFLADIAYHQDKLERGSTELIDIFGADHHGYVPRMKAAIEALGYPRGTFHAIVHQLVHLMRGKEVVKMSKRAGEFITLRELVEEAGLDACRFFFALRTPNSHMSFDLELAKKQSNENPVFYVQYVHARICSIFREAVQRGLLPGDSPLVTGGAAAETPWSEDLALLEHPIERTILLKLAWFPDALEACERELSPNALPTYLLELAGLYHKFYELCHVLDPEAPALSKARLTLCAGVRALIAEGLDLLGVSKPEKM